MKSTKCDKCGTEITNPNYKKHYNSCDGTYIRWVKSTECKWCNVPFTDDVNIPNHIRWCEQNPKSIIYKKELSNRSIHNNFVMTDEARSRQADGVRLAHIAGKYDEANRSKIGKPGIRHTTESKEKLRQKALASPHRRLVKSCRNYTKKDGTVVKLDSSWEEALAIRLDELDVNWSRPSPIKWVDRQGLHHNYFPDFYLSDTDVFLDPKNPQALKVQKDKIECLTEQIKNLIIITSLEDCRTFTP